jgi:hypothetical protein
MIAQWQNFYVIAGSSAGALTGLQFVVMTLVTQARASTDVRNIHAFGTPTVIHFCTALLLSAVMTAPWQAVTQLGGVLAACGLLGVGYSIRVFWHARLAEYQPDTADWIWYVAAPFLAHLLLVGSGVLIYFATGWSLVAVAANVLIFLLLGVHNSWDTVTYLAIQHGSREHPR